MRNEKFSGVKARWIENEGLTNEQFKIYAKIFVETIALVYGRIQVYLCMIGLLEIKKEEEK